MDAAFAAFAASAGEVTIPSEVVALATSINALSPTGGSAMKNTVFWVAAIAMLGACADDPIAVRLDVRDVAVSTPEDTALTVQLQVDTNRPVQATLTKPPTHGVLADLGSSIYSYTPAADYTGPDTIEVSFSNGMTTVVGTVNITVTPVDDAPLANPDSFAAGFAMTLTTSTTTLLANDTDIEGDALSITEVTAATHGTATLTGGNVVFVPEANFQGQASYAYRLSDGTMSSLGNVTVSIGANSAPIAGNDTAPGTEDTAVVIQAQALLSNDTDGDSQTLAITSAINPTHGTVTLAGTTITFTPDANYNGPATFQYTITDGAATDDATVTVNLGAVNDAPLAVNDAGFQATEDNQLTFTKAQLLGNDSDVDGDNLTITSVGGAVNCTVSLPASLIGDTVLLTPTPNFNGTASFTYTISDGTMSATGTVSVTVGAVNDAPIATDDTATGAEDTAIAISAAAVLANDTDADGQPLSVTAVANATNGTVSLSGGAITFTPTPNFSGAAQFDYTVSDGTTTDVGTVTVTVTPVNDAPEAFDDTVTTPEDVAINIQVLLNDLDLDGDALAIMSTTQPLHGTVVIVGTAALYTPAANYFGPDSFTYTARDPGGLTDMALVTINVTSTNDGPVGINDLVNTPEDTAITIDAAANDTDADGDTLAVTTTSVPAHGTAQVINGQVLYTPALNYNGPDGFTYTATDGNGGQAMAMVSITVGPVNDAPVAVDDTYVINDTTSINVPGVLINDSDVDSTVLTVTLVSAPTSGTLVLNPDGSFTYFPEECSQLESFTYTVSDGQATSNIATVTLSVNHRPIAVNDPSFPAYAYQTTEGVPLTVASPGVLGNDIDPDPQALTSQIGAFPQFAQSFTLHPDGSFTYVPEAGFTGCDTFTYTAADATTVSLPATVTIMVGFSQPGVVAHGSMTCGVAVSDDVVARELLDAVLTAERPICCLPPQNLLADSLVYGCDYIPVADPGVVGDMRSVLSR